MPLKMCICCEHISLPPLIYQYTLTKNAYKHRPTYLMHKHVNTYRT